MSRLEKLLGELQLSRDYFPTNTKRSMKWKIAETLVKYKGKSAYPTLTNLFMGSMDTCERDEQVRTIIEIFDKHSNLPGVKGLASAVYNHMQNGMYNEIARVNSVLERKDIISRLKEYENHKYIEDILYEIGIAVNNQSVSSIQTITEIFLGTEKIKNALFRFGREENKCLIQNMFSACHNTMDFIDLFDKCKEHSGVVASVCREYSEKSTADFNELYTDRAVERILKSKNPAEAVRLILESKYSEVRELVEDTDISYNDMDLIKRTYKFVMGIHEEREDENKEKIKDGFFSELKRAMQQGDKSKNIREYCREVKKLMQENASELMVMYDA